MKRDLDFVTYELVGINPREYYAGRFAVAVGDTDLLARPEQCWNIDHDRAWFLCENLHGPHALDIGCGSGPLAATIRAHTDVKYLAGIDLDPTCVDAAARVYDTATVWNLEKDLPFPDASFDSVFSCDLWGHIEFRVKDRLLQEVARVTRPNGRSVHAIESGIIPYERLANSNNNNNWIREYVWMEGHIGVETAPELQDRWGKYFSHVRIENAFVPPLAPIHTYLAHGTVPDDLAEIFRGFNEDQLHAAQIILGYISRTLKASLRAAGDDRLTPDPSSTDPLRQNLGLVYLVAEHPFR